MRRSTGTWLRPRTLAPVVAGVAGVVLLGSLLPVQAIPTPPSAPSVAGPPSASAVPVAIPVPAPFDVGVDKVVHALSYALLAGVAAAWRGQRGVVLVGVVVAVAAFGVGVEVAQSFVPGRTASTGDAVANLVGAVGGVAGWWLWSRPRHLPWPETIN